MRVGAVLALLLAAACGADASRATTEGAAVVPAEQAGRTEATEVRRPRRERARRRAALPDEQAETPDEAPSEQDSRRGPAAAADFRIRVLDADGAPVEGATVALVFGFGLDRPGRTGADGTYRLDAGFDSPSRVVRAVASTHDGRVAVTPWSVRSPDAGVDFGDVRLRGWGDLASDEERAAARVWAAGPFRREVPPDSREPSDPPPPDSCGEATLSGRVWFRGEPVTWSRTGGCGLPGRTRGCPVTVLVCKPGGATVRQAHTDRGGAFWIESLAAGPWDMWFAADPQEQDASLPADHVVRGVTAPTFDMRVDLPPAAMQGLSITSSSAHDDSPRAFPRCYSVRWEALDGGPERQRLGFRPTINRRGPPRLRLRADGRYSLRLLVERTDGLEESAWVPDFTPSDAALDLRSTLACEIAGVVVGAGGLPIPGARVRVLPADGEARRSADGPPEPVPVTWTAIDGSFRLQVLDAGAATVVVEAPGILSEQVVNVGDTSLRLVVWRRD